MRCVAVLHHTTPPSPLSRWNLPNALHCTAASAALYGTERRRDAP